MDYSDKRGGYKVGETQKGRKDRKNGIGQSPSGTPKPQALPPKNRHLESPRVRARREKRVFGAAFWPEKIMFNAENEEMRSSGSHSTKWRDSVGIFLWRKFPREMLLSGGESLGLKMRGYRELSVARDRNQPHALVLFRGAKLLGKGKKKCNLPGTIYTAPARPATGLLLRSAPGENPAKANR